jgi:hypothetical protein
MNERVQNSKSPIYKWDMLVVHATILHNNCTIILICLAFSFLRHVCCYPWNIKEKVLIMNVSFQMRWNQWRDDKREGATKISCYDH